MRRWKRWKRKLIGKTIRILFIVIKGFPPLMLKYFLKFFFLFLYLFLSRFRLTGIWTLKTAGFKKNILRKYFKNLSDFSFDILKIHNNGEDVEKVVECKGEDILKKKFEKKKGVLVLTLHMGMWEIIPIYFKRKGYPVNVVVSTVYTKEVDDLINSLREKENINVIHRNQPIKIVRAIKRGECVGILMDHDFGNKKMFTTIFGRKVSAPVGPLILLYKFKPEVLLMRIFKDGERYKIEIKDFEVSGDKEKDMQKIMKTFEGWIREKPDQWTWIHDRFGYIKRWKKKRR